MYMGFTYIDLESRARYAGTTRKSPRPAARNAPLTRSVRRTHADECSWGHAAGRCRPLH